MMFGTETDMYEPTFELEKDFIVCLGSALDTNSGYKNGTREAPCIQKVGALDVELLFRRKPAGDYDATMKFSSKSIDPHWSCKVECTYEVLIEKDLSIYNTERFDINIDNNSWFIGSFGEESDSPTNGRIKVHVKIIDSAAIHHPLEFDFTKRTKLSDATIILEGGRVHVTKAIVAMQSSFFKRLFDETIGSEITLHDVKHDDMIQFLTLIYPHTTSSQSRKLIRKRRPSQLDRLVGLASRFECPSVLSLIEETLLNRTLPDRESLVLSDKHGLSLLCTREISRLHTRSHYKALLRWGGFPGLSEELRSELLENVVDKMSSHRRNADVHVIAVPRVRPTANMPSSSSHPVQPSLHPHRHPAFLLPPGALPRPIPLYPIIAHPTVPPLPAALRATVTATVPAAASSAPTNQFAAGSFNIGLHHLRNSMLARNASGATVGSSSTANTSAPPKKRIKVEDP